MKPRREYNLPQDKEKKLRRAIALEWVMIPLQLTVVGVMYLAMGSSQAMKAAWIEDMLALFPPIVFLIAMHVRSRKPDERFPYGYRRAPLLAFLGASVTILMFGLYILYDSASALLTRHYPTLGHYELFGQPVWIGWLMVAALSYGIVVAVVMGRLKLGLAKELHEKSLFADAEMNKADWMTAGAGIVGVLGVGMGLWWADSAAAIFISIDIVWDGMKNMKNAMADLMDRRPTNVVTGKPLYIDERIHEALKEFPEVERAAVRLREAGHIVTGELFVQLRGQEALARRLNEISERVDKVDWRLYNLVVMPVEDIDDS